VRAASHAGRGVIESACSRDDLVYGTNRTVRQVTPAAFMLHPMRCAGSTV
jgi:hypothetical protein